MDLVGGVKKYWQKCLSVGVIGCISTTESGVVGRACICNDRDYCNENAGVASTTAKNEASKASFFTFVFIVGFISILIMK